MSPFSERSDQGLAPNALTRALSRIRAAGGELIDLRNGNPTTVGLSPSASQLEVCLRGEELARYRPEAFGRYETRALLAKQLRLGGHAVDPTQIMLSASTSDAYSYLFKLLCDPGDEVLVPSPSYPLLNVLAQLEGVVPVPYRLAYDGQWHIAGDALKGAVGPRTRAVVAVHPNNPTGSFLKEDELVLLASLGLPVISDEVFADYALAPGTKVQSALVCAERCLVFRLEGLSKSLALPQLKLAWTVIAGPPSARDAACERLAHIADAHLSVSGVAEASLARLWPLGVSIQKAIVDRCRTNLALLRSRIGPDSTLSVLTVEGGWYAILRLPAVQTDEAWALGLLEHDHVWVQPGYLFDLDVGAHLVLSLITPPQEFACGVSRLLSRVDRVLT